MSVNLNTASSLDLARQQLAAQATNGKVTLDQALETAIGGVKLKDLPDVKGALTGLAVNGQLPLETVLTCVNSRYDTAGSGLVPKGAGAPLDAKGMDLNGLSGLAQLMLLLINNAAEQRKTGQEIRFVQSEAIQNKLLDAAADMRKGAIIAMALGVASGVASIVGGAAGFRGSADLIQSKNAIGGGIGTILNSVGQGVQGLYNAEAKEKEAEAEKMRSSREAEGDTIAALKDFIQATINLVQTMLDKETDTMTRIMV
jgi:hypothetical protein